MQSTEEEYVEKKIFVNKQKWECEMRRKEEEVKVDILCKITHIFLNQNQNSINFIIVYISNIKAADLCIPLNSP